ncbi:hypothetical protein HUT17_04885 (plasmid) [Nocardiopsis flavescens]|nr:hypothetical protein HUT17_04885 [Nocardiopsis flavescens]
MLQLNDVRMETMRRLYDKNKGARDAEYLDIIDTALNLALGHRRAAEDPDRLVWNVLRDARRTHSRSAARARQSAAGRPLADPRRRRVCTTAEDGSVSVEMATHESPEAYALVSETLRELSAFAASLGAHGPGCLRDMLDGETVPVSACRVGVSVATVERARRALRGYARSLVSEAATA